MKENPLVSVIIPVYNAEKTISETIGSVIAQTYTNWELIVIDDCSTDGTIGVVEDFVKTDKRILLIKSAENFGGPAKPRNIGIRASRGEYLAFCDADDIWMPAKLEKQAAIAALGNADLIYTGIVFVNYPDGRKAYPPALKVTGLSSLIAWNKIPTSSVFVKKSGDILFDEDKGLTGVEDYHLWLTLYQKGLKFHWINETLVNYCVMGDSLSHKRPFLYLAKRHYAIMRFMVTNGIEGRVIGFEFVTGLKDFSKLVIKMILKKVGMKYYKG